MFLSMDETILSPVHELARAALACLRQAGRAEVNLAAAAGGRLDIAYRGPAMPKTVPPGITGYQTVLDGGPWEGAHRLVVRAPLVVLDVCWNPGEPVRIMGFSRGDWERHMMEAVP
jgi:hypothetical protein